MEKPQHAGGSDTLDAYNYGDAQTERCSTCGTPVEGGRGEEWCVQCAAPAGERETAQGQGSAGESR